ncbi:MAG TPA: Stk1 family PASTA domain-containing Ser/Thr kinase [Propionibacteriaceae bacterium]|nr:Stk1 family PASTA domain-containing Ser/Thr kinase [Propionibacteriaceae bacterium]
MTTVGDPLVGRLLDGRYQITERLARGGMATVYRAVDTRLTRTVAVKVMHVGLGDDAEFARKFDREARAAARLAHPNVVAVFDQGSDLIEGHSSRPYIVMEHVDGHTLRDVINREAPMLPLRALEVIEPVLAALAAAHDAGLVHRDVKPENVLISDRGQIKVADFGLAKAISSQTSTATQGLLIGTVSYLPPELVVSGQADARSDVYSTGVVLFELLTGRKPHTGDTPIQVAYAHVHADVPAPSRFPTAGPVPPYLDALVARATSRTPSARPADARVLLTEVRRVQSALRDGRRDDPELVRDLRTAAAAPAAPSGRRDRADYEPTQLVPSSVPSPPTVLEAPPPAPLPRPLPRPDPALSDGERIARQRQRQVRRRRRGVVALLLVLLLTTGVAVAGWYLTTGRFTSTPALASLSQSEAERVADRAGLDIQFTEDFSESVPPGRVIETDPSAGSKILKGGRMVAAVSGGPERFAMPTVVGLSRDAAETAVQRANLSLDEVNEQYSDTVRDGVVISASKKPGSSLKRGTEIDLVVSKGPAPIPVKNYVGEKFSAAEAALGRAGFRVAVERQHSDEVAKGLVLAQDPTSGEGQRGDTITLTESLGPVLVRVPNVSRMGIMAAEQVMAKKGFKTRVRPVAINYLGLGYVAFSGPRARSQAPKGSTITLYVV